MQITQLNHIALYVKNVEMSAGFYENIIGLERMERPAFDFPGAWFRIGKDQQLHIIGVRSEEEEVKSSKPRGNHFALKVNSINDVEKTLLEKKADFIPPRKRPDGAIQIFIKDPDGYFIELVELIG